MEKRLSVDRVIDDCIKVYETTLEKCKHESEMQTRVRKALGVL